MQIIKLPYFASFVESETEYLNIQKHTHKIQTLLINIKRGSASQKLLIKFSHRKIFVNAGNLKLCHRFHVK